MKPAMMALVVAIAGMIEPAIFFTFHFGSRTMWKQLERRLDAAATTLSVGSSSLSNWREPTCEEEGGGEDEKEVGRGEGGGAREGAV